MLRCAFWPTAGCMHASSGSGGISPLFNLTLRPRVPQQSAPIQREPGIRMTAQASAESHPVTSRYMPVLLLLFVGSGCAALVYEIVWFQLLELVIGSSAI